MSSSSHHHQIFNLPTAPNSSAHLSACPSSLPPLVHSLHPSLASLLDTHSSHLTCSIYPKILQSFCFIIISVSFIAGHVSAPYNMIGLTHILRIFNLFLNSIFLLTNKLAVSQFFPCSCYSCSQSSFCSSLTRQYVTHI